jgi:hypothetical protein
LGRTVGFGIGCIVGCIVGPDETLTIDIFVYGLNAAAVFPYTDTHDAYSRVQ